MRSEPYWPLMGLTDMQKARYDTAWKIALAQAGGINKLATRLSAYTGEYISHQAIRNWRRNYRIPPQWAMVLEDYTHGKVDFFVLVPWLKKRFKQARAA